MAKTPRDGKRRDESEKPNQKKNKTKPFLIVGVGASAGGLEAAQQLLQHLPTDTGMAFVLVQHLDPTHESALTLILSKATKMPVTEVTDEMRVEPNHVYIIPPNTDLSLADGHLRLTTRTVTRGQHMPIDSFFRSLATVKKSNAIGVILSGTGSDGALGIQAIKAEEGITFAQDEGSAKYSQMPLSAVATGCVDFVMPPQEISRELLRISQPEYEKAFEPAEGEETGPPPMVEEDFTRVLTLLRKKSRVDFSHYKHTTIRRRMFRRMVLQKKKTLSDYVRLLESDPTEVESLYNDILINVTDFFREPETYDALKEIVFPAIMKDRPPATPIRIWVPGCATGEEVYSIIISLMEFLGDMATNTIVQVFATDISDRAIEKARAGIYLENSVQSVSPERLRRFFTKVENGFQISKHIRDMCIFATQNVTADPPFSRLDLISCRNLLIYLGAPLQKRVVPIFHYALKETGFLILSSSETIGVFSDLFSLKDKKQKIYSKKPTPAPLHYDFPTGRYPRGRRLIDDDRAGITQNLDSVSEMRREAERVLIGQYIPSGVIVNSDLEVVHSFGDTGPYLMLRPGVPSLSLLKMAREGLSMDLRSALHKARKEEKPSRKEGVRVKYNGSHKDICVDVTPLKASTTGGNYFLVLFREVLAMPVPEPRTAKGKTLSDSQRSVRIRSLEQEVTSLTERLKSNTENLEATIEEQEASNEELKSANEEIMSSNEELQSTNEELETSKEELQSTNEELNTVNDELQNRNAELSRLSNDLTNVLGSIKIPLVLLDQNLHIRRFTPAAEKILKLISTDIGRPITDIKPKITVPNLDKLILDVIDKMTSHEEEVRDEGGHWHLMRIQPYRTSDNKIDGAVLTLFDIHNLKTADETAFLLASIVQSSDDAIIAKSLDGAIMSWNQGAQKIYGYTAEEATGKNISILIPPERGNDLSDTLRKLQEGKPIAHVETVRVRKDGKRIDVSLTMAPTLDSAGKVTGASVISRDITDQKSAEAARKKAMDDLARANGALEQFAFIASHDLQEPVRNVSMYLELLRKRYQGKLDKEADEMIDVAVKGIRRMQTLVDALLAFSRTGSEEFKLARTDCSGVVKNVLGDLSQAIAQANAEVICERLPVIEADAALLTQVFQNLIANAVKFRGTEAPPKIQVSAKELGDAWEFSVKDNGIGIDKQYADRVFLIYQRLHGAEKYAGAGIGLATCKKIVEIFGGRIWLESEVGKGSTFFFTVPKRIEKH